MEHRTLGHRAWQPAGVWVGSLAAFAVLVLASAFPSIAARAVLGQQADPAWLVLARLASLALIAGVASLLPARQELRVLSLVLLLTAAGFALVDLAGSASLYRRWEAGMPPAVGFAVANAAKIVPTLFVASTLALTRVSPADIFLRIGRLNAGTPLRLAGRPLTWLGLVGVFVPVGVVAVAVNVTLTRGPSAADVLQTLLTFAPVILIGAAVNTFCEEFLFRNSVLPFLRPLVGTSASIWLTALRFGSGHFTGNPSGPVGVLMATVFGALLARSMLDTRGSGLAWLMHWIFDVVIFSLIALTPGVGHQA
jgi:membrane protease YdiL (CAAX protease family)